MMMNNQKPQRIQRKRTKGWRMPKNTVYVGRGSRWGNPYYVGHQAGKDPAYQCKTAEEAVKKYADLMFPYTRRPPNSTLEKFFISNANLDDVISNLRGKNLACWCEKGDTCHADVLLQMANPTINVDMGRECK
jgi:hypothetical protein